MHSDGVTSFIILKGVSVSSATTYRRWRIQQFNYHSSTQSPLRSSFPKVKGPDVSPARLSCGTRSSAPSSVQHLPPLGKASLAELSLHLLKDGLLQLGGVMVLHHVEFLPGPSPLLSMLHLLRGQAQVKADALDVEVWPLPALGPRLWLHPNFDLAVQEQTHTEYLYSYIAKVEGFKQFAIRTSIY